MIDNRTTETYNELWFTLKMKTNNKFSPSAIVSDFELGFRNSSRDSFLGSEWFGDKFHFIRDNLKWINSRGGKFHRRDLAKDLRELWGEPNIAAFNAQLEAFKAKWEGIHSGYMQYFISYWLGVVKPSEWAKFGSVNGFPSGDQWLEAWHRRFKGEAGLQYRTKLKVGTLLEKLQAEAEYFDTLLEDPELLNSYKKKYIDVSGEWLKDQEFVL